MDGIILFGIIGVVFFFLGPIGFFIALGNGRRIGTLEREVAGLRADLKSGAAAVSPRHCQSNGRSSAYGTACPNPSGC